MRLFVAIELPDEVREHLDGISRQLRDDPDVDDSVSWVPYENAHITLKFLGDVGEVKLHDLMESLNHVEIEPLTLRLEKMLYFPMRGPVHVLSVGVEDCLGTLSQLHDRIEAACESTYLPREQRAYRPHVTLGRWRPFPQSSKLTWIRERTFDHLFPGSNFSPTSFTLFRSHLHPDGAKHEVVAQFGLNPNIS